MIFHSKSLILLIIMTGALLTGPACIILSGAGGFGGAGIYEGYLAPVYSADGQYVYYVERSTNADVKVIKPPDLMMSPPQFGVSVANDTFSLKRLQVQTGKIEELTRLSPSPIEGRNYEVTGRPFYHSDARLKFKGQQLEFNVCLSVDQKDYFVSGVWNDPQRAAEISQPWKESHCELSGYDEWPIFGDSELMEIRGDREKAAIVAYNHVTNSVKTLVQNKQYEQEYPDGLPLDQIRQKSVRATMDRERTMLRTHAELLAKHKAAGMSEIPAQLETTKDMQRLGFWPKPTVMVARRLSPDEIAGIDKSALFSVEKDEMASGVFPDIEEAIAKLGEEVERASDYHIHRDYTTSARLNTYLKSGKKQFYIRFLGHTYELTIKKP